MGDIVFFKISTERNGSTEIVMHLPLICIVSALWAALWTKPPRVAARYKLLNFELPLSMSR